MSAQTWQATAATVAAVATRVHQVSPLLVTAAVSISVAAAVDTARLSVPARWHLSTWETVASDVCSLCQAMHACFVIAAVIRQLCDAYHF